MATIHHLADFFVHLHWDKSLFFSEDYCLSSEGLLLCFKHFCCESHESLHLQGTLQADEVLWKVFSIVRDPTFYLGRFLGVAEPQRSTIWVFFFSSFFFGFSKGPNSQDVVSPFLSLSKIVRMNSSLSFSVWCAGVRISSACHMLHQEDAAFQMALQALVLTGRVEFGAGGGGGGWFGRKTIFWL